MFLEFYRLVEFHLLLRLVEEEYIRTFRMFYSCSCCAFAISNEGSG